MKALLPWVIPALAAIVLVPGAAAIEPGPALAWLEEEGYPSPPGPTEYLELALAGGFDPTHWPPHNPVLAQAQAARPSGMAELRAALALEAAGQAPALELEAWRNDGQYGDPALLTDDIWALRLMASRDDPQASAAVEALRDARIASGSWHWAVTAEHGDTDVTGMAMIALHEAGAALDRADGVNWLLLRQREEGGWAQTTGATNCQSTVWALHGLQAAAVAGHDVHQAISAGEAYLASLQAGGLVREPGGLPDAWCSVEALSYWGSWHGPWADGAEADPPSGSKGAPMPWVVAVIAILWASVRAKSLTLGNRDGR